MLGFLSGKVLGQFEFFDRPGGQLLLVAPNLVAVERQLSVDPSDFRLWVCLHEVTHRVQFTAVPWLRQHMLDEVDALAATRRDRSRTRCAAAARRGSANWSKVVRGPGRRRRADGGARHARAARDPRPGHRVHVAGRGPRRVRDERGVADGDPEPAGDRGAVRGTPAQGRQPAGPAAAPAARPGGEDPAVRRRLGVRPRGGRPDRLDGFNAIWTSRETLPTKAEIADPRDWITRVHA